MWKQGGRSSALDRAQAALSSRRGRGTAAAAPSTPARVVSAHEPSMELLSSHSDSSLSSGPAHTDHQLRDTLGPNLKSDSKAQVGRSLSSLESGASRFLKKAPPAAAQDQPEDRTVSSLRRSQTAALSFLSQIENRFGKGVQKRSPSRVGQTAVPDVPEEQKVSAQPSSAQPGLDQPRRFMKSRTQPGLKDDRRLGQPDSPEHSAQERSRRQQLPSPAQLSTTSPAQAHPPPKRSLGSPLSPTPSPPDLSPAEPSPSPPAVSLSPPAVSPSPPSVPLSPPSVSPSPLSLSAVSALGEVHSLEELFPLGEVSESACEDFQMNVLDLDELEPAALQREEEAREKVLQEDLPEDPPEEPEEEDYPSDFESVIQTESLSEHLQDSAKLSSPPSTEPTQDCSRSYTPPHSEKSQDSVQSYTPRSEKSQDSVQSYSPPHSEKSQDSVQSYSPPHSEKSQDSVQSYTAPRSEGSYSKTSFPSSRSEASSPEAPVNDTPLPHTRPPYSRRKPGQHSHWHAHSAPCPSLELLMESLRQQLALTSQFISSSREHHARVLQNLGPPNYTYTTLQNTQEYIWKQRASRPRSKKLMGKN